MILTVTLNPAVDQTMSFPGEISQDAINRVDDARYDAGGKGINVSKYLTELGQETVVTAPIGGFLGEFVRETLSEAGVDCEFVEIDGRTRMNTTVLADDSEYKFNQRGPDVTSDVVDQLIERITARAPSTMVIAGSLPPGLDSSAVDRIAGAGDWNAVVDLPGTVLRQLEGEYALCKPNRTELAEATDRPVGTVTECQTAAESLRESGFERVLASLGPDGAVLASPDGLLRETPPDIEVVDTVGAGDALLAGALTALHDGGSDDEALATGVRVASRAVSTPGTDLPTVPSE